MEGIVEGLQAYTASLSRRREADVLMQLRPKSYIGWNSTYNALNPYKYTTTLDLPDIQFFNTLSPINIHLNDLAKLQSNWDGYGAMAPSPDILEKVRLFLKNIPSQLLSILDVNDIYPNPNGTITIEWHHSENLASLEFGINTANYFTRINSVYAGEEHLQGFENAIPSSVIQAIESIFC